MNYCLLRLDSIEKKDLTSLLQALFNALRIELNSSIEEGAEDDVEIIDVILTALKTGLFKLSWNDKPGQDDKEQTSLRKLTHWTMKRDHVTELVQFLCNCLKKLENLDCASKWGKEAFDWATGTKDIQLSVKALHIYRSLLTPLENPMINELCFKLVEATEKMEESLSHTLKWSKTKKNSSRRIALEEGRAAQYRNKVVEILSTLQVKKHLKVNINNNFLNNF